MLTLAAVNTDAALHAAWRSGDPRAAIEVVVRYRKRLCGLGRRLGLSHAQAEELAQEVLLAAPGSTFEARAGVTYWDWLAVIARRTARRMLEVQRELPIRRYTTPWSGVCRIRLLEAVDQMPRSHRDVFARLITGYTVAEIADQLGIAAAAVYMRICRGRKWLRAHGF